MNKIFKPISKRDAKIAAVLFGAVLIVLVVNLVKSLLAGAVFEELHNNLLLIAFAVIVEFGMVTIATSKDKEEEAGEVKEIEEVDAGEEEDEEPKTVLEGENEREGSEEFTEGLNEEFDGHSGSEGGDIGGAGEYGGDAGSGSGGEGGGEAC